jgi:uncharacterized membrane protein YjgN (DUF898 family)
MRAVPEGHTPARYDGRAAELFKVYLQNVALTVATLGVYRFWARVRMTRYRYQHTAFGGARFDYHATGREKLVGFLKGMLVLAPSVAGLWLLHDALVPHYGDDTAFTVSMWSFLLLLFLLRPLIVVGSQRFNLSRTSWCNVRFRFAGRIGAAYGLYLRDLVLMVVTLGIYSFWHQCNVRRFKLKHTRLGDLEFDYRGDGSQLFGITLGGTLLCYVTAGIYAPWLIARLHRYHLEHTYVRGHRFRSRLTGGHVLSVGAPALLVSIVTLGLALPWALDRWYRLLTDTTSFPQPIDVDRLRALPDTQASPVLEGVGEAGEALSGLGDLFGG